MYGLRTQYQNLENSAVTDIDALGSFFDNHDNARFLSIYQGNITGFKNAACFALTARGIPFFYYGDEQTFSGGNDPANRESLWDAMNTDSDMYKFVATINKARQAARAWDFDYVERYVMDDLFSYSFGDMLVITTNHDRYIDIQMPYLPYEQG